MNKVYEYRLIAGMFVLALAAGFVVACSTSPKSPPTVEERMVEWNAAVDNLIAEPQRAKKIKQLGQQFIELKNSMAKDFAGMTDKAAALNANYNTTADEAQRFFKQFEQKRKDALARYRDLIFALRSEVSVDEWKVLIK